MDIDLDECDYFLHTINYEKTSWNDPKLLDISYGKCYFPFKVLRLGIPNAAICSRDSEGDGIDVDPMEEHD